jgi:hypothetical protein
MKQSPRPFNIILSQPRLESNVEEICVILQRGKQRYAFDDDAI